MERGINLSSTFYYISSPFVDLMKCSQPIDYDNGNTFQNPGVAPLPGRDASGWPLGLDDSQTMHAVLRQNDGLPSGNYAVHADGVGTCRFSWPNSTINGPTTVSLVFDGSSGRQAQTINLPTVKIPGSFHLWVDTSSPDNPLRNISIIMPGYKSADIWRRDWLDTLSSFTTIRFMDFMRTNGSVVETWGDRNTTSYTEAVENGVKYELIFDLATRLGKDAWVNIPEDADDDYVMNFIALANDLMNPDSMLYVEYSNEYWNPGFPNAAKFSQRGLDEGLSTLGTTAALMWGGRRAAQIHQMFTENYNGNLCRIIASQANQVSNFRIQMTFLDSLGLSQYVDAFAEAPYFTQKALTEDQIIAQWPTDPRGTLSRIITGCRENIGAFQAQHISIIKAFADQYGKRLLSYECGQTLLPSNPNQHTVVYDAYLAANHSNCMVGIYIQYLKMLEAQGIELSCLFSHIRPDDVFGFWGMMNYLGQPLNETPKWRAVTSSF